MNDQQLQETQELVKAFINDIAQFLNVSAQQGAITAMQNAGLGLVLQQQALKHFGIQPNVWANLPVAVLRGTDLQEEE